jgi:hypothetical protein
MDVFAPSAAAAGVLVRDGSPDATSAVWREDAEPALLRPSAVPAAWIDSLQRARLAHRGVNALRSTRTPSRDLVALRTLAGDLAGSPDMRLLGARRLALLVASSIESGTRWVTIEGNTGRSRERVCRQVEQFLRELGEVGAFAGVERNRHYFVLCDQRLNTPVEHAAGVFRLVFGFQSVVGTTCQTWLVEHRPGSSSTRAVSLNQLAALELRLG